MKHCDFCCSFLIWQVIRNINYNFEICRLGSLTFEKPDKVKYPSMDLAYAAGRAGGTMTGVLSAANEKAVEMFINEQYVHYSCCHANHLLSCLPPWICFFSSILNCFHTCNMCTWSLASKSCKICCHHYWIYTKSQYTKSNTKCNTKLHVFRIGYLDIFKVVELTCDKHQSELVTSPSLEDIVHYDLWARDYAASLQLSSGRSPVPA